MLYGLLAETVVILHFMFILFVVLGGLLLLWSKKAAWLHIPAAIWGTTVEFTGWVCPLTPLENSLRIGAEGKRYNVGFIENYMIPVIYPEILTPGIQIALGSSVILINIIIYSVIIRKFFKTSIRPIAGCLIPEIKSETVSSSDPDKKRE